MADTSEGINHEANKIAQEAIKELDESNNEEKSVMELIQDSKVVEEVATPSKVSETSPSKLNSIKNDVIDKVELALAELANTNKNENDEDIIEMIDDTKESKSEKKEDNKKDIKSDDDIIEEITVTKTNNTPNKDKKSSDDTGDNDIIQAGEVTRKKVFGQNENKSESKVDSDGIEEIEMIVPEESEKSVSKKRKKDDGDGSEIEVIDDESKKEKIKIKQEAPSEDIEIVATDGDTSKSDCSKRKRTTKNGECDCENSVKWNLRSKELDALKTLLTQQQQTLQSQQLLQQQQYVQQKEFLKQQGEFMKNQKLTMENMDKLLQVLANNAAVWSGLGDAMAPSDQIKQENIKKEVKKESNTEGTTTVGEVDEDIAILPTPPKIIETVDLDEADGKDGKNKKDYYNVYRGQEIHDRMPTAEEKRIQEEVTKLLKG